MLFTAFSPANKPSLCSGFAFNQLWHAVNPFSSALCPLHPFHNCQKAKYIIRPLIPVMLTHPSNPPPSLFIPVLQFLPPSRFSSQACWHGRWAALKCPCLSIWSEMWLCVVWGGQRVFFTTPLDGPNVKVFQALKSNHDFHSRCSGGSHRSWDAPPQKVVVIAGARTVCASVRFALCIFATSIATWCWRSVVLK